MQRVRVQDGQGEPEPRHGLGRRPQPPLQQKHRPGERGQRDRAEHQRPPGDTHMTPADQREHRGREREQYTAEDQEDVLHAGRGGLRVGRCRG